ncbi:hypothetical protein ETU08_11095 [Apibacter muscae]|uniref:hypothetical protein n=2 Tax=Apibacter muscae TaxID=2509004 RepID=UPI0011AC9198|nr:hypothetical protein [Apibacter muscae]TWP28248.1 hypothetical protein ETU08_11095 [Apibacter muscae]
MKPLILASFYLFSCLIFAQKDSLNKADLDLITQFKTRLFIEIVSSQEFQNKVQCKIVTIPSFALEIKKKYEYLEPRKDKDTLTLGRLRDILPSNYWVFLVESDLEYIFKGEEIIEHYIKEYPVYSSNKISENMEGRKNPFTSAIGFFFNYCDNEYDIIKIYEPFDKWGNLYSYMFSRYSTDQEIVIPVKYEHSEQFSGKENYMLFKFKVNIQDNRIISKEVISD